MDAGVVSGLLHLATQAGLVGYRTLRLEGVASKRPATASGCGGALATPPHTLFQQPASGSLPLAKRLSPSLRPPAPGERERDLFADWHVFEGRRAGNRDRDFLDVLR